MVEVRVREATEGDVDELLEVYHSAYAKSRSLGFPSKAEQASGSDLLSWMNEGEVFLAQDAGTVVGADASNARTIEA